MNLEITKVLAPAKEDGQIDDRFGTNRDQVQQSQTKCADAHARDYYKWGLMSVKNVSKNSVLGHMPGIANIVSKRLC